MELDSTVLLNLKCEEIPEIGTPIMAQTKVIFKFRELSKRCRIKFSIQTCKFDLSHISLFHGISDNWVK